MKYLLALSLFILCFHAAVFAQVKHPDDGTDYNKLYKSVSYEYGFDQVLINGISYEDKYWNKVGHQFFQEDRLYKGDLMYRGKEYKGLEMKYDIYDQQLILYISDNNLAVRIIPPFDFISEFSLDDKFFSKYNFQGEPRFYQVVFDAEKLKCLYFWSKKVEETGNSGYSTYYQYEFTDSEKKSYLKLDGSFERYKNNRSFTELFPQEIKTNVNQYIKTKHIKVAKSSDEIIIELLSFCNSLL